MFHHCHDTPKCERFVSSQLGQDFAIQLNIALRQGRNKGRIAPVILPDSRLQAHNPEFPPFPLFPATISVSVLPSLFYSPNSNRKAVFGATAVAFGMFQESLVLFFWRRESKSRRSSEFNVQRAVQSHNPVSKCTVSQDREVGGESGRIEKRNDEQETLGYNHGRRRKTWMWLSVPFYSRMFVWPARTGWYYSKEVLMCSKKPRQSWKPSGVSS